MVKCHKCLQRSVDHHIFSKIFVVSALERCFTVFALAIIFAAWKYFVGIWTDPMLVISKFSNKTFYRPTDLLLSALENFFCITRQLMLNAVMDEKRQISIFRCSFNRPFFKDDTINYDSNN